MKKLLVMATALVAALTINAQTYDITAMAFAESDLTATNGTITNNETSGYFEVKNNAGETLVLTIAQLPNIEFSYKNSAVKTGFKVAPNKYIQADGDQRDITFKNVAVGSKITLTLASKGSKANSFEDSETKGTGLTGCVWVSGNKTQAAKVDAMVYEDITVQAIASTVTLRTTAGGYALQKIVISSGSAVENAAIEAKAVKSFENGQLVILKNGVKYNALGTVIE